MTTKPNPLHPYSMGARIERVARQIVQCPYCHVEPGNWCVAKSGGRAAFLHMDRWREAKRLIAASECK